MALGTRQLPTAAALFCCLLAIAGYPERLPAAPSPAGVQVSSYDDAYIRIEAAVVPAESRQTVVYELRLTPQAGWKISVDNASAIKPLRIAFQGGKCLKAKGAPRYPAADLAGTDESGSYSEYYTKTAVVKQEFTRLACAPAGGYGGSAKLTYLLCQDNRCIGPFTREIKFKSP